MHQIIECVPNFSEGRRPEVYNAIAEAISTVPGAHVIDISADPDHNRSVITFFGNPAAVEEGAFRAIAEAARLIDLDDHEGEHPRIGATDVCPFIPVKGVTVDDCISLANRLGRRVGEELDIAVYLYGSAATKPERRKLSAIRKGEYEKWLEEVASHPGRKPDYGPAEPKPWGATVIGVRPFLIAYNIYLNSTDVKVANQIARAIRFSTGGLRYVQALGFLVDGQAQVSMNLTNFKKTQIHNVQEMVRREAARYGLTITKAELIGMAPEQAFINAAQWYLQIDDLGEEQLLEKRITQSLEDDFTPYDFLEATAAGTATPGGGSTAALAGAASAALTQMVANLTVNRKKYAAVKSEMEEILSRANILQQQLTLAIREDSEAFNQLMSVWRNKELSGDEKALAIELATIRAGEVPLNVAQLASELAELSYAVTEKGNINAVTDAAAACIMARAAVQIATLNVKVNSSSMNDQELAKVWQGELAELDAKTASFADKIITLASERGGF
jgi:glutamate formiminotransferase/formiminotetrahydrofolate cyclodeaminase